MPEQRDNKGWREALRRIEEAKQSDNTKLDLNSLGLATIPDSLTQLTNLRQLYAFNNQLTTIPDPIAQLTKLEDLNLGYNQLTTVPHSLARLSNLHTLRLYHNQLTAIPEFLVELSKLEYLSLWENQLTAIPDFLAQLSRLQSLDLSANQITSIPESIAQLPNLLYLYLNNNQLAVIPDFLAQSFNLRRLNLSNNRLTIIPDSLQQLQDLAHLFLHGNPDLGIPDEVLGPTYGQVLAGKPAKPPREILNYLSKLGDARPLNEAKLIMVGQGAVGKSSLVKKLTTGKFKVGEKATEGIKISDWSCRINRKDKVTVHIWDFGGQEMMHATHQFFLTQRSLYLLVLNRRQGGADREADYWFRLIRAFGGKDAPVIVVLNKQKPEPFDVNRGGWLEKYSENIRGFVGTDCTDGESIKLLKHKIQLELGNMTSIKSSFPRRWFAIKNELSQMSSQFITFEDYRAICRKHKEDNPESQTSLAGFLHDLGIALNYKDDPRLRFGYVLKPEWVTEGIYALLHAVVANKGLFARADAEKVLKPKGYSVEATEFIMGLMEQFELSFPLGDSQKRVLIPELLDDQQPAEALSFKAPQCLNFGYKYSIVPEGLLPRFIVRTHHLSQPMGRWKSGVILEDKDSRCRALVRAESTERQIRVHIDGPKASRRELLGIVRYNFQVIHSDYEFKPIDLVYPAGAPEKPLHLTELEALARSGATSMPVVLPDNTVINPRITDLIEPVKSAPAPLKLFLSYSHKDEKYVNELRKDLKLMERNGLIVPWYDRALTAGEKWEALIFQELNDSDVIVCQISRDFLNSDFCVLTELKTAIERQKAGEATLIAYILTECGWKEVPELSQFQVLPKDAKPLIDWKDKNKYWRAVAEGIQSALKELQKKMPERRSRLGSMEAKISGTGSLSTT